MNTEKPLKIAIIGLGHIGRYHIQALEEVGGFKLVAICDRQQEYASLAPEGAMFYNEYLELLANEEMDTVIVATPNSTHYRIARDVLEAGHNLIIEKPATENLDELKALETLSEKKNKHIYYSFHAAHAYEVEWTVNEYLPKSQDELGPITGFRSRFYDPYILDGRLLNEAKGLQNCWIDSGINALSVIERFINLSQSVVDNISTAKNPIGTPPFLQCHVELCFNIDAADRAGMGTIDTNWTRGQNHKSTILHFSQSRNIIQIDHSLQQVFRILPSNEKIQLADFSNKHRLLNHYIGVFRDYLNCLSSGHMNQKASFNSHRFLFRVLNEVPK